MDTWPLKYEYFKLNADMQCVPPCAISHAHMRTLATQGLWWPSASSVAYAARPPLNSPDLPPAPALVPPLVAANFRGERAEAQLPQRQGATHIRPPFFQAIVRSMQTTKAARTHRWGGRPRPGTDGRRAVRLDLMLCARSAAAQSSNMHADFFAEARSCSPRLRRTAANVLGMRRRRLFGDDIGIASDKGAVSGAAMRRCSGLNSRWASLRAHRYSSSCSSTSDSSKSAKSCRSGSDNNAGARCGRATAAGDDGGRAAGAFGGSSNSTGSRRPPTRACRPPPKRRRRRKRGQLRQPAAARVARQLDRLDRLRGDGGGRDGFRSFESGSSARLPLRPLRAVARGSSCGGDNGSCWSGAGRCVSPPPSEAY